MNLLFATIVNRKIKQRKWILSGMPLLVCLLWCLVDITWSIHMKESNKFMIHLYSKYILSPMHLMYMRVTTIVTFKNKWRRKLLRMSFYPFHGAFENVRQIIPLPSVGRGFVVIKNSDDSLQIFRSSSQEMEQRNIIWYETKHINTVDNDSCIFFETWYFLGWLQFNNVTQWIQTNYLFL